MSWTVKDLVQTKRFSLRLLVRGDLERSITWIHTTEVHDPSVSLAGGEVVLTAGVWLDAEVTPDEFISHLVKAKIAALGFGLGDRQLSTPAEIVDICQSHGLTLFEVPAAVPFIALTKLFAEWIARDREAPLVATVRRNQDFTRAVNDETGLAGILSVLGRAIPKQTPPLQCYVCGPGPRTLASSGLDPTPVILHSIWHRAQQSRGRPFDDPSRCAFPVLSAGRLEACLVVDIRDGILRLEERAAVEQAVNFIGIEMARRRATREGERRFAIELVDLLAQGAEQAEAVAARLPDFGIDLAQPSAAIVCLIGADNRERCLDAVENTLHEMRIPVMAAAKADRIILVVQWQLPDEATKDVAGRLADAVGTDGYVGFGSVARNSVALRRSLIEAEHISRLAKKHRSKLRYATYRDMGSHRSLLALQDPDVLAAFKSATLQPLLEYDSHHQVQLIPTLAAFLQSGQRWASTAAQLTVHVNTLRHRLARVEVLTGRSLSSLDDVVDLYLALDLGASRIESRDHAHLLA
jgi:sugar diacid utilization regulator